MIELRAYDSLKSRDKDLNPAIRKGISDPHLLAQLVHSAQESGRRFVKFIYQGKDLGIIDAMAQLGAKRKEGDGTFYDQNGRKVHFTPKKA